MSIKKQKKVHNITTVTTSRVKQATGQIVSSDEDEKSHEEEEARATPQETQATRAMTSKHEEKPFEAQLVWTNIILFVLLHSALPIGAYMIYAQRPWLTLLWMYFGVYVSVLGVTAGTHRLWSHRSYKARWPIQVLLMFLQTMAGQNSIYTWSRDHRVHHKYAETNADPHNILRGFFFAHMGWLCCKKHPDVKDKGALIDMSDLEANPVVMFQHRNFWWLAILFTVLVPTIIPMLLWDESFWTSFVIGFMWRYIISLHGTWLVNSAAHYHGDRPYDDRIEARESPVVIWTAMGEGFHNYHHTFPFDYSTSEYGPYFNITTAFIDLCYSLGLAYDLRKIDTKIINARRMRTGDQREIIKQASLISAGDGQSKRQQSTINEESEEQGQDYDEDDDGIELVSKSSISGEKTEPLVACNENGDKRPGLSFVNSDLTALAMKYTL